LPYLAPTIPSSLEERHKTFFPADYYIKN